MKRFAVFILLILFCWGESAVVRTAKAAVPRLTLMIYMTGSNLESEGGAASDELAEMCAAYADAEGIDVIVMASGSKQWRADIDANETSIYALRPDGLEKECAGVLRSMGESDTLLSLLAYGYEHHPAEEFALILWDHGAGPMMGVCFDEMFPGAHGMDSLSLEELADALSRSPFAEQKLAWIGFDACLMASVETAAAVAPYADYMIASQDTEPVSGWDYSFLRDLGTDKSPLETGRRVIDGYFSSIGETMSTITMSMVDLSVIPDVAAGMDELFGGMSGNVNAEQYPVLTSCRINAKGIANASPSYYDLVDLGDLLETYEAAGVASCGDLLAALRRAVVLHRENADFMNGLSVYYPYYNKETYLAAREDHAKAEAFAPGYETFLNQVSQIWLGDALADWNTGLNVEVTPEAERRVVSMQLTAEQAAQYANGFLYVLEEVFPNEYRFVYMTDEVTLTSDNQLESAYEGKALFMVDGQGNPLTDALTYFVRDDMLFIPGMLRSVFVEYQWESMSVFLVYRKNEQGEYTLTEVLEIADEPVVLGKSAIRLSDWNGIEFLGYACQPTYDETGTLLPYNRWPSAGSLASIFLSLDTPDWHPAFLDLYSDNRRIALLQVQDNQQNAVYNGLVSLDNPNLIPLDPGEMTLLDDENYRITLTDAELIGGMDPGLRLVLRNENLSDQKMRLSYDQFAADKTFLDCSMFFCDLPPNDMKTEKLTIPAECFQQAHVTGAESFDMWVTYEWTDVESETEQTSWKSRISFSMPVDFTSAFTVKEQPEPQATARLECVEMAIDSLRWNEDGNLDGVLRMTNTSDQEIQLGMSTASYLNDIYCFMDTQLIPLTLPGGCTAYRKFEIVSKDSDGLVWPDFAPNPLSLLGVNQITSVGMNIYFGSIRNADVVRLLISLCRTLNYLSDYQPEDLTSWPVIVDFYLGNVWDVIWDEDAERVVFSLHQALDYPSEDLASWPVIYDSDGVTVALIGSEVRPDSLLDSGKRFFCFYINNETDRELFLEDGSTFSLSLDKKKMEDYSFSDSSVPAHTRTCVTLSVEIGDDIAMKAFDSADIQLGFYDYGGRSDTLVLHLETLREPEADKTALPSSTVVRYIYRADAFRITAQLWPSLYSQLVE